MQKIDPIDADSNPVDPMAKSATLTRSGDPGGETARPRIPPPDLPCWLQTRIRAWSADGLAPELVGHDGDTARIRISRDDGRTPVVVDVGRRAPPEVIYLRGRTGQRIPATFSGFVRPSRDGRPCAEVVVRCAGEHLRVCLATGRVTGAPSMRCDADSYWALRDAATDEFGRAVPVRQRAI